MLQDRFEMSERRACRIVGQHRSTQRRPVVRGTGDEALRKRLREFSNKHKRWGYPKAHAVLRDEGWGANRKKIQRLWREEGLQVPQKTRKRRRVGTSTRPADRLRAERPDHVWALDFQFEQTSDGKILKLLNIVDEHTREELGGLVERRIDADRSRRQSADLGSGAAANSSDPGHPGDVEVVDAVLKKKGDSRLCAPWLQTRAVGECDEDHLQPR
jgi:transposase InsO family protein